MTNTKRGFSLLLDLELFSMIEEAIKITRHTKAGFIRYCIVKGLSELQEVQNDGGIRRLS